jgi:hypothetical protein
MSIIKFIYNTNSELFKTSESSINDSLIDDEQDLEAGEGYYYKKLKEALLTEDTSTSILENNPKAGTVVGAGSGKIFLNLSHASLAFLSIRASASDSFAPE